MENNVQELKELELIFNQSINEIFVTDGDGVCIQANPACEANFGIPLKDLIGMNVHELVQRGAFFPSATLKVLKDEKPVTLIQSTVTGKRLYVSSTPVFENGKIIRVISTTIDITEILSLKRKINEMETLIDTYNQELIKLKKNSTDNKEGIVVNSPSMKKIFELLQLVARVDSTVLLLGESGVGKTQVAHWIHQESHRSSKEFVEVNCAAIPATLFESELFGYEPGSFSGASSSGHKGLIESANGGTLFLDEIGELPLELQTKILQFMQNKTFRKIGGQKLLTSDVRIISATNRNLNQLVKEGKFREDLYYRLSVIPVAIPPLRERKEDLVELIYTLLNQYNQKYDANKIMSAQTMEELVTYDWPGNVRELKNTMERMFVTTKGIQIDKSLNFSFQEHPTENTQESTRKLEQSDEEILSTVLSLQEHDSLADRLDRIEKEILQRFHHKYRSTRNIAQQLHSSQSTISRKLSKYDIY